MKIGDRVFVHGYIDEIRKDTVIVRNDGGYFGTIPSEVTGELPSAQPQRTGHWIEDDDEMFVICSECGEKNDYTSAYCPDCGTRMERY